MEDKESDDIPFRPVGEMGDADTQQMTDSSSKPGKPSETEEDLPGQELSDGAEPGKKRLKYRHRPGAGNFGYALPSAEEEDATGQVIEDGADRAMRRMRYRRLNQQAQKDKEALEEEKRKKAREEAHKARLARFEKQKQLRQQVAKARARQPIVEAPPVERLPLIRKPEAPCPDSPGMTASRAAMMRNRQRRKVELARKQELELKQEQEKAQQYSESQKQVARAHKLAKARVGQQSNAELVRKMEKDAADAKRAEEKAKRLQEKAKEGNKLARKRLRSDSTQRRQEDELRKQKLQAQLRAKKEKAAAQAKVLPKIRAQAGKRAQQQLKIKHMEQDVLRMRKEEQARLRIEKKKQYSNPFAIYELKQKEARGREQAQVCVLDQAVLSVSTAYCSTGDLQVHLDDSDVNFRPSVSSAERAPDPGPGGSCFLTGVDETLVPLPSIALRGTMPTTDRPAACTAARMSLRTAYVAAVEPAVVRASARSVASMVLRAAYKASPVEAEELPVEVDRSGEHVSQLVLRIYARAIETSDARSNAPAESVAETLLVETALDAIEVSQGLAVETLMPPIESSEPTFADVILPSLYTRASEKAGTRQDDIERTRLPPISQAKPGFGADSGLEPPPPLHLPPIASVESMLRPMHSVRASRELPVEATLPPIDGLPKPTGFEFLTSPDEGE